MVKLRTLNFDNNGESGAAAVCGLEVHVDGEWCRAGTVHVEDTSKGIPSPGRFEYDFDYLDRMSDALGVRDARAVSCRYAVGYESFEEKRWPAFLLDVIPSGAARRFWEAKLGLPNTDGSDWQALIAGAAHPPGNVRIADAKDHYDGPPDHPGFPRSDILDRHEGFIEYAHACGAPISGSSGAGGDSPKFLLREDLHGRWHADGALPDERTKACWLVKFPRTLERSDQIILEAEAAYHRVARLMGVRTYGEVTWERDCLFVPRFDRIVADVRVEYLGLESLCSLSGVAEFGVPIAKERLATALAAFTTDRKSDLREFVLRDLLDVALGNTDNHARNTSVIKRADGRIALSPLYDLAPMILDRRGIARVCRWADRSDYPDWSRVADALGPLGLEVAETKRWLRGLADPFGTLPNTMRECGVPDVVVARCKERVVRVARSLAAVAT